MLRVLALLIATLSCQAANADVRQINRGGPTCDPTFKACILVIQINGEITDDTATRLENAISRVRNSAGASQYTFTFLSVELNSPGGSVDAAMKIGRILRKEGPIVDVKSDARCLSACILILAGATTRGLDGTIGIHRPYFEVPGGDVSSETIKSNYQQMLRSIRAYLKEMNVVESLADDMLRTNPEHMRVLSENELTQYGLTDTDPIAQEALEIEEAKALGLDRKEYMRRKLLVEHSCGGSIPSYAECRRNILKSGNIPQVDFSQYGRPAGGR
jgi:hypothetical protein